MEAETRKHTVGRVHRHHASGKRARTREGSGAVVAMGRAVGVASAGYACTSLRKQSYYMC